MKKSLLLLSVFTFLILRNQAQTITDIDGNVYHTVIVGSQIWMHENLKVTHYRNGDPIPNVKDSIQWCSLTNGALCNYNNDTSYISTYGSLYNWYAATDSRNLCPVGWHVPSETDLTTLFNNLGNIHIAGRKLKEIGCAHWFCPNEFADDSSGLTALPGGYRDGTVGYGGYSMLTLHAGWWTSTLCDATTSWILNLNYDDGQANNYCLPLTFGFYMRCIKDSATSIKDFNFNDNLEIFPNPSIDKITINSLQNSTIEIFNIQGQLIKCINANESQTTIDVSGFARGMYFVKVKTESGIGVKKFVKE